MSIATGDKQDGAPSCDLREEPERIRADADEPLNEVDRLLKPDTPPKVENRFRRLSQIAVRQTFAFVGPFPQSFEAARYEEVTPAAADRFLTLVRK